MRFFFKISAMLVAFLFLLNCKQEQPAGEVASNKTSPVNSSLEGIKSPTLDNLVKKLPPELQKEIKTTVDQALTENKARITWAANELSKIKEAVKDPDKLKRQAIGLVSRFTDRTVEEFPWERAIKFAHGKQPTQEQIQKSKIASRATIEEKVISKLKASLGAKTLAQAMEGVSPLPETEVAAMLNGFGLEKSDSSRLASALGNNSNSSSLQAPETLALTSFSDYMVLILGLCTGVLAAITCLSFVVAVVGGVLSWIPGLNAVTAPVAGSAAAAFMYFLFVTILFFCWAASYTNGGGAY